MDIRPEVVGRPYRARATDGLDVKTPGALLGGRLRASWRQQDQPLLSPPVLWSASGGLADRHERYAAIQRRCDRANTLSVAKLGATWPSVEGSSSYPRALVAVIDGRPRVHTKVDRRKREGD
jgi:hypothetical protein